MLMTSALLQQAPQTDAAVEAAAARFELTMQKLRRSEELSALEAEACSSGWVQAITGWQTALEQACAQYAATAAARVATSPTTTTAATAGAASVAAGAQMSQHIVSVSVEDQVSLCVPIITCIHTMIADKALQFAIKVRSRNSCCLTAADTSSSVISAAAAMSAYFCKSLL
jgi:hypothetical protein